MDSYADFFLKVTRFKQIYKLLKGGVTRSQRLGSVAIKKGVKKLKL